MRALILPLALLLSACTASDSEPQTPLLPRETEPAASGPAGPTAVAPADLVAGQTEFGLALYRQLASEPGNLFLSPASVSMALGMVYSGAEDETAAEMRQALRYPDAGVDQGMASLLKRLPIDAEGRQLRIANALWVQKSFALKPEWRARVHQSYGGGARQVDFVAAPGEAIATINAWAQDQTAGRIKGLLQRQNITERTRLILTNAVWLKADWLRPFQAQQTRPRPFHLAGGGTVTVPMMRQRNMVRLLSTPGFEAVELPYKGEELSMLVFLPKEKDGLRAFEAALDAGVLTGWIEQLRSAERADLELVLPKLELDTRASLVPPLQALGMRRAFTEAAQLHGIADATLRLSDVIHQTYLRVDEKGTEAAAATAGIAEIVSMPRPFHADHPFFFVIRDDRSGSLLFVGRIERPTAPAG